MFHGYNAEYNGRARRVTWMPFLTFSGVIVDRLGHVLLVAHHLHPLGRFPLNLLINRDMRHGGGWRGSMPVFLARVYQDNVTRPDFLDRTAPALCQPTTICYDQRLTHRMAVPQRASARLECDPDDYCT